MRPKLCPVDKEDHKTPSLRGSDVKGRGENRTDASRVRARRAVMRLHFSVFSITEHSGAIKSHDAEQLLL